MWFWPVNEMIEPVSGMPAAQFGDESLWVRWSQLVQGSSGSCVSFWLMWDVFACPGLKATGVAQLNWRSKPSGLSSEGTRLESHLRQLLSWLRFLVIVLSHSLKYWHSRLNRATASIFSITQWLDVTQSDTNTCLYVSAVIWIRALESSVCWDVTACSPLSTGCMTLCLRRREFP
jgi:hypothetical protein